MYLAGQWPHCPGVRIDEPAQASAIRRLALCGIAAMAVLASINAAAHSYIGLHAWAASHGLNGWWAWS